MRSTPIRLPVPYRAAVQADVHFGRSPACPWVGADRKQGATAGPVIVVLCPPMAAAEAPVAGLLPIALAAGGFDVLAVQWPTEPVKAHELLTAAQDWLAAKHAQVVGIVGGVSLVDVTPHHPAQAPEFVLALLGVASIDLYVVDAAVGVFAESGGPARPTVSLSGDNVLDPYFVGDVVVAWAATHVAGGVADVDLRSAEHCCVTAGDASDWLVDGPSTVGSFQRPASE